MLEKLSITLAALAVGLVALASPIQSGHSDAVPASNQSRTLSNDGGGGGP
jgi:hypothetical protein